MKGLVLAALVLTLGCERQDESVPVEPERLVVTNVVEVTREVVVTNVVTETVTNAVVEKREPVRILSARKTAPYAVSAKALTATQLRKLLAEAGARVVSCDPGAVALVEASDKTVRTLGGVVTVAPLSAAAKIDPDVAEAVRISPLSSIDAAAVAAAVRDLGGEIEQVVTVGSPVIRAKLSGDAVLKLAERGDVRAIERDGK